MEEKTICSVCGAILTDETAMKFDGKIFYGSGNLFMGAELEIDKAVKTMKMRKYCLISQTASRLMVKEVN